MYLAMNFHDAGYLYGLALAQCLKDGPELCDFRNGAHIMDRIRYQYFDGRPMRRKRKRTMRRKRRMMGLQGRRGRC